MKMEQLANMHMNMMKSHDKFENETRTSLNNQAAQLRNLEVQMSSLLSEMQHENLPSTSEVNSRREGKEHYKTVTLRSGNVTPPTRHPVSSEGATFFFPLFPVYYKLINFKLVHSYNVKNLT